MLLDHRIPKPLSTGVYAAHRLVEGLTAGDRPLFVDMGDHLVVRSARPLTPAPRPVPETAEGEIRAFELRASCGVKVKGRHRYFPLADWRARHDWLRRRAAEAGFEVLNLHVTARQAAIEKVGRRFSIDCSDFTGILRVTDAAAFRRTLAEGLPGPGRAFGHGMLVI